MYHVLLATIRVADVVTKEDAVGRERGRQHKLRYEVLSVKEKSFAQHLHQILRARFSVCEAEVPALLEACLGYLEAAVPVRRAPLQIVVPLPAGRELRRKVDPGKVPCIPVTASVVAEDDAEVWLEQGVMAMQIARIVRLVEEADRAGATAPATVIAALVALSSRTVVGRLVPLWDHLRLPLLGITGSLESPSSRLARVLEGFVQQRPLAVVRQELLLSPVAHRRLLASAARLVARQGHAGPAELAAELGLSPTEVNSTRAVVRLADSIAAQRERLVELVASHGEREAIRAAEVPGACRAAFVAQLIRRHAFSPARADALVEALAAAAESRRDGPRSDTEVLFWAISDREPAGKRRADCDVVGVRLPYYESAEDLMPRGTVLDLKVRRARRLAVAARSQGGLLSLPDLAFLVGMGTSAMQQAVARAGVFLPTRGAIADIGRGVTHRKEIVTLYVQGHTEPEIVRRTQHTYESVGSYIRDFRRVMALADRDLPVPHIRKVLRMSRSLVQAYLDLYRELDVAENQWKLNLMRLAAVEEEKKPRSP